MKTSLRKLMSTFSDLGSVRDEDSPSSPSARSEARSEVSSYKRGFTFTNSGKRKEDKKEVWPQNSCITSILDPLPACSPVICSLTQFYKMCQSPLILCPTV